MSSFLLSANTSIPSISRQYTLVVCMRLSVQSKVLFFSSRSDPFPIRVTLIIRKPNLVQEPILYLADSALFSLACHSEENTVCTDLIESAANRRHTLWALSA